MRIYVAHPYNGKEENKLAVEQKIEKLCKAYPFNTYVSPIHAFGFLYGKIPEVRGMDMCLDLKMRAIWRGYQGHFIGQCRFHLNTLIDFEDSEIENIIVSTIGAFVVDEKEQRLGLSDNDFYETSVFHTEIGYWDIDGEMTPFEDIDPEVAILGFKL